MTVPTAITVPAGKSTGSLQVMAVSPLRAAGLLLIMTVALPIMIWPLLVGGFWKGPPCGRCGGRLSAVLPCVAAGIPMILTLLLKLPLISPLKGLGRGVGTGPPGDGII